MKPILLIAALCIVLFVSCDCWKRVSGTVVDKKTGLPIDSALVESTPMVMVTSYSDENGEFTAGSFGGGPFCSCLKITVSKEG